MFDPQYDKTSKIHYDLWHIKKKHLLRIDSKSVNSRFDPFFIKNSENLP